MTDIVLTISAPLTVVDFPASGAVLSVVAQTAVIELQAAGVQGPQGAPGLSSDTMTLTALGAISALRVVSLSGAFAALTAPASVASLANIIGISTNAAADGGTVILRRVGQVSDPAWAWVAGLPLFCAALGVLTQTPPATVALRQIGVAVNATTVLIDLSDLILLE